MSAGENTVPIPSDQGSGAIEAPRSRGRAISAVNCLVLAAVLMTPGALAYWGQRTLNDTERYLATVAPLIESPEVQDAIAVTVTSAIEKQVDTEALINDVFSGVVTDRPRLQRLVGPLSAAINSLIDQQVREFIASDAFADVWVRLNTRAQQTMLALLRGEETGAVQLQGDQVVLDVSDVIDQVKLRLVERGLTFVDRVPIPEVDRQIVLLDAPQLRQARTAYAFGNPVAQWLLPLVLVLFVAAFALARRRPRMTVAIGIAFILNAAILAFAMTAGRTLFINELSGTPFGRASSVFYATLLSYLDRGQGVVLWAGLILIAAGVYAGASGPGTSVRNSVAGGLEKAGAALPDGPASQAANFVAANVKWLRYAALILGIIVLAWGNNMNPTRLFWCVGFIVALLAVLQILVGAARAQSPQPVPIAAD